ncbi:hypothetical protein ACTFIW_003272 [Dictyostelium discoideum]
MPIDPFSQKFPGMTPAFASPAVIITEDPGPIRRDVLLSKSALFTSTISCRGIFSVVQNIRGISDSIASNMQSDSLSLLEREAHLSYFCFDRAAAEIYFCFDRAAAYRELSLIEEKNCTEMAAFFPIQNKLNNTLALHTSKKGANRSTEFLYEIEEDQYPTLFFRAQKQLSLWSEALNIEIVAGKDIGDSAAVAFDTASSAKAGKMSILLTQQADWRIKQRFSRSSKK